MNWIFWHGFGFGAQCWQEWLSYIPPQHVIFLWDRGYFFTPAPVELKLLLSRDHIVVTHSFGLHQLPLNWIDHIRKLVIIGGFQHIHPRRAATRSKAYVQWLMGSFQRNPQSALKHFYRRSGLEWDVATLSINVPLLWQDLQRLHGSHLVMTPFLKIPQVLILHGAHDQIVAVSKAEQLRSLLPNSKLVTFKGRRHALGLVDVGDCFRQIEDFIKDDDLRKR